MSDHLSRSAMSVEHSKGAGVKRLQIGALVALYLAAIVAANLTLTHWGPLSEVPVEQPEPPSRGRSDA